jgi:hypothetical protein
LLSRNDAKRGGIEHDAAAGIANFMSNPRLRRLAAPEDLPAGHEIYMHPEGVPFLGIDPAPLDDFRPVFDGLLASGAFYMVPGPGGIRGMYRVNRQEGSARSHQSHYVNEIVMARLLVPLPG